MEPPLRIGAQLARLGGNPEQVVPHSVVGRIGGLPVAGVGLHPDSPAELAVAREVGLLLALQVDFFNKFYVARWPNEQLQLSVRRN